MSLYPTTNKQALLYGVNDLRIEDRPVPQLKEGEILVKIGASTTCGTDKKTFLRGGHPKIMKELPAPIGHEMAGTVIATADDVETFSINDRVVVANSAPCHNCFYCDKNLFNLCEDINFLNGAFSEYLVIPKRFVDYNVHSVPDDLEIERAVLAEPLSCVLHACEVVGINSGDKVALLGTGPMAALFIQVINSMGAQCLVIGRKQESINELEKLGAMVTINSSTHNPTDEVKRLTQGYGADVAIEAVGTPETWQMCLEFVRKGGRVCAYGGCAKGTDIKLDTYRLHYDQISLHGVFHYTPEIMKRAICLLADGKINVEPFISQKRRLEDLSNIFLGKDNQKALKYLIQN